MRVLFIITAGTDDNLPPSHQNKFRTQRPVIENTRTAVVNSTPFLQMQNDMEVQIHQIEQEAYCSVLRAFKAQSDAISWEMESLITELRKELRVTDDEHRKLLSRVNSDDLIGRIREWRKVNVLQPGMPNCPASASYKKQKPSLSYGSTGFNGRGEAPKQQGLENSSDPLIGRKVWTRWPEDNSFYEAVISDFNPIEGNHALVYDAGTPNEAWEWVNLREISPNDIRWKQEDVGISRTGGGSRLGHGMKKSMARGGNGMTDGPERRNGIMKGQSKKEKELPPSQNGIAKKALSDIQILHTDTLVKEVDRVFSSSNADPMDIENARKLLKEHEQALVDAIAKLESISDFESDREQRYQF
uniref:ENT domain-containing protein n=1 Tax=Lactuca sativa TaxID=4236 RepID=A0A9R1WEB8_LACSA|nr:hypothetical protein LSAT_V11C200087230 [Lactuca sativa]